ncbi:MAG: 50S ribosomal protein L29 [Planctomycetaceae bacterium]|nr:50S ribosomal protein L29 [Planctomycetaceae bacterium]
MAKKEELTEMSDEQLNFTLEETRKSLFELRFQSATERLDTPSQLRKLRRQIARILTVQRQRELKAASV